MPQPDVTGAIRKLLTELLDGSAAELGWVLNPEDPGLLRSLDRLSAEEASAVPPGAGASVAAHVDHLRYGLEVLNRWSEGEDLFSGADYAASWRRTTVTEAEWRERLEALRRQASAWREAIARWRDVSDFELTGIIASVVHLAYHLGAIRQINRAIRGPAARD